MNPEEERLANPIEASTEEWRKQREHTCTCGGNCNHERILCPECTHANKGLVWITNEDSGREYLSIPRVGVCRYYAFPARKCPDFEPKEA